ncbi:unnamed protein product (mitochondrion) [Musa textilis]
MIGNQNVGILLEAPPLILACFVAFIHSLFDDSGLFVFCPSYAIGQRQSWNSGKHPEVSIQKPAFRKDVIFNYARFTGVVFLSWEFSDELGKLPKGMASPGRLRTHQTKRSRNWSPLVQSPPLGVRLF